MKWSVIMMCYLGDYPGSRSHPVSKFHRAVQSFKAQNWPNKELIIVSDGCRLTENEYRVKWGKDPEVKFIWTERSRSKWPGSKRQIGVDQATGDWITYLDSDDIILPNRLEILSTCIGDHIDVIVDRSFIKPLSIKKSNQFELADIGQNYWKNKRFKTCQALDLHIAYTEQTYKSIEYGGTYSINHRAGLNESWQDSKVRGEDINFCKDLIKNHGNLQVETHTYVNCHWPGRYDL